MGFGNMKAEKEYNATKYGLKGLDRQTYDFILTLTRNFSESYSGTQPHIQSFWKYAYDCVRNKRLTYNQYLKIVVYLRQTKKGHLELELIDEYFQREMRAADCFNNLGCDL